mgnify:CR=1 FL=1
MPEYVQPDALLAQEADDRAEALFRQALVNNQRGDNYALLTVIFASVLFFAGIATSVQGALAMIGVSTLTGLAFAAPMTAYSVTQKTDQGFAVIFRLVITPLTFFSGTYFPIENLPEWAQFISWCTPLAHGVALSRGLALGVETPNALAHALILVAWTVGGTELACATSSLAGCTGARLAQAVIRLINSNSVNVFNMVPPCARAGFEPLLAGHALLGGRFAGLPGTFAGASDAFAGFFTGTFAGTSGASSDAGGTSRLGI